MERDDAEEAAADPLARAVDRADEAFAPTRQPIAPPDAADDLIDAAAARVVP